MKKGGVVELEEVLSQLSEMESSEDEEALNDEKEEVEPDTVDLGVSESSVPSTPTPPSSPPHTPCSHLHTPPAESYSPVIGDQSYSLPQAVDDLEPSEDNLSLSGEGSDSDTEPELPPDYTVIANEEEELVGERGESLSGEGSDSDTEHELSQDDATDVTADKEVEFVAEKGESPVYLSELSEPEKQVIEQVTEIDSSLLLPASFEGEVSIEVGDPKDDSSEMISTLSAQVQTDYSEITKVLEQELSSDDDSDEVESVFKPEEESHDMQGESHDETLGPTCVVTTNTEKVKGETTGWKRTVSKEDVLGISKPKKPQRKRLKRKGGARARKASLVGATAPVPVATPPPTSLVVSIKKALYEVPPTRPSALVATPPTPPPTVVSEPLIITINRHLLRHPKFRLPSLTPDEKPKPLDRLKIRLAKFGSPSTSTPKPPRPDFETTPTSVQASPLGPRKRELDVSPSGEEFIKRPKIETQVQLRYSEVLYAAVYLYSVAWQPKFQSLVSLATGD